MQLESGENVADEKDTWKDKEKKIEKLAEKVMEDKLKDLKLKEIESEIEENSKKIKEDSNVIVQNINDTAIRNGYNVHKELGNGWYSDGIAENIGMMEGYASNDVADAMMKSWMNSPGHRANILDANYDFIGVGVAYNGYGTYDLTQDFK